MEKETSTRRSLLRALYLLPLVCICLAVNAQTKVQYRYVYDHSVLGDSTVTTPDNKFVMSAYKIPQGTDMDSLIRSLPGVEVNENGELTVNGKSIGRILVNGQAITFGNSDSSYYEMKKFIEETIRQAEGIKTNLNKGVAAKGQAVNDTILSYSTNYKLHAGESVEDLINKLFGIGTDDDGTYTVNGKAVSRILVNGEELKQENDEANSSSTISITTATKSIDENGNITIDTQNGTIINLNGTQTTK